MATIPVTELNAVKKEAKACIIEDQGDPEQCIIAASKRHNLTKRQMQTVADNIMNDADED